MINRVEGIPPDAENSDMRGMNGVRLSTEELVKRYSQVGYLIKQLTNGAILVEDGENVRMIHA